MDYAKAVEVGNLKENAAIVLRAVAGMSAEDAMNALGAAAAFIVIGRWSLPDRSRVLEGWVSMISNGLRAGE